MKMSPMDGFCAICQSEALYQKADFRIRITLHRSVMTDDPIIFYPIQLLIGSISPQDLSLIHIEKTKESDRFLAQVSAVS